MLTDGLAGPTAGAVRATAHVSRARVKLGEQESSLGAALVARDVAWDWVAVGKKVLLGSMGRGVSDQG